MPSKCPDPAPSPEATVAETARVGSASRQDTDYVLVPDPARRNGKLVKPTAGLGAEDARQARPLPTAFVSMYCYTDVENPNPVCPVDGEDGFDAEKTANCLDKCDTNFRNCRKGGRPIPLCLRERNECRDKC